MLVRLNPIRVMSRFSDRKTHCGQFDRVWELISHSFSSMKLGIAQLWGLISSFARGLTEGTLNVWNPKL